MSIILEQYRASIGGFTPPGLLKSLKRRKAAAWRELLGEEVVDRVGREVGSCGYHWSTSSLDFSSLLPGSSLSGT